MKALELATLVKRTRFAWSTELALHAAIAAMLDRYGVDYRREVRLSDADRIDFMVGAVGVEVKVAGARKDVKRQLSRYARSDEVEQLLLITTRAAHLSLHGCMLGDVVVQAVRPAWM